MSSGQEDWAALAEQLAAGDSMAFVKLSRLVVGNLTQMRAYDFREDWSDVVQEVLTDLVRKVATGGIEDRRTVRALIAKMTRFKFLDHLRRHYRRGENKASSWEEVVDGIEPVIESTDVGPDERLDLERAVARLDPKERAVVVAVHVEGMTYEQAAVATGIPLGSAKRYLRTGLKTLRAAMTRQGGIE